MHVVCRAKARSIGNMHRRLPSKEVYGWHWEPHVQYLVASWILSNLQTVKRMNLFSDYILLELH
jgi:hypothetical protein